MTETTQEELDCLSPKYRAGNRTLIDNSVLDRLVSDANLAAGYERACVRRSEGAPEWADEWSRDIDGGCVWTNGVRELAAPDLRPNLDGPVTLTVVDA